MVVSPVTQYGYDMYGDELSQTDANGHVTTWTYDSLGHQLSSNLPRLSLCIDSVWPSGSLRES